MTHSAILALDPGKTTGWAIFEFNGNHFTAGEADFNDTVNVLTNFVNDHREGNGLIVSESFIINQNTPKNTQAPWSLELIGVARYFSRWYLGVDLPLQAPSSAKTFSTDRRLKHLGFWTPGKGHANDASRHLLLAMSTRGLLPNAKMKELVDIV